MFASVNDCSMFDQQYPFVSTLIEALLTFGHLGFVTFGSSDDPEARARPRSESRGFPRFASPLPLKKIQATGISHKSRKVVLYSCHYVFILSSYLILGWWVGSLLQRLQYIYLLDLPRSISVKMEIVWNP